MEAKRERCRHVAVARSSLSLSLSKAVRPLLVYVEVTKKR